MATKPFIAEKGLMMQTLGSFTSLAIAAPLAEGSRDAAGQTDPARIGRYYDRTTGDENETFVCMGKKVMAAGTRGLTSLRNTNVSGGGDRNEFFGYDVGNSTSTGTGNFGLGQNCMLNQTSGGANTAVGIRAMQSITNGALNTAVGASCMKSLTTANHNAAYGYHAMEFNLSGEGNIAIGSWALEVMTSGAQNVAIGRRAGDHITGSYNVVLGGSVAQGITTGSSNVAVGQSSLPNAITGVSNIGLGRSAGTGKGDTSNTLFIGSASYAINTIWITSTVAQGPQWQTPNRFLASSTTTSGVNLGVGVAPTVPADGDLWVTTAGMYVRVAGATTGPLLSSITLSGDVTGSGGASITTTISAGAVTLAKMANLAASSLIGNNTAVPATPLALSASQVKTLLAISSGDVSGLTAWATKAYPADAAGLLRNDGLGTLSWDTATYLTGNQTITLSNDATGSGTTSITVTLASTITAGGPMGSASVVPVITYDAKGRLTNVSTASITPGAIGAVSTGVLGQPSGVATLDALGKLLTTQLPPLALTDTFVVGSQALMLALVAEVGDIAVRTDTSLTYILQATPASVLANWVQLLFPPSPVLSVNGYTNAVVLSAADVGAAPTARSISTQYSLTGGGDLSANRTLNLVNDISAPGASQLYGTDGSGVRGWFSIPSALPPSGSAGGDLSGTYPSPSVSGIRSTSVPVLATGYLYYNGSAFAWQTPTATIAGSIAVNQVAYGSGTNAIQGAATFTFDGNTLSLAPAGNLTGLSIAATGLTTAVAFGLTSIPLSTGINDGKAFSITAGAETFARVMFYSDGKYGVGPGSAGRDVYLGRAAAGNFRISGDGASSAGHLDVMGGLGVGQARSTSAWIAVAASDAATSGLRLAHGTAPTTPVNGDIWTTVSGLYARISGTTVGPLVAGGGTANQVAYWNGGLSLTGAAAFTYDGTTLSVPVTTVAASTASRASLRVTEGVDPTVPVNGDIWTTTGGLYGRINSYTMLVGQKRWHGIESYTGATFNNASKVVTFPACTYWYQGVRRVCASNITVDLTSVIAIGGANKIYYVYFPDSSGVLVASATPWGLKTEVPVITVYWNGSAGSVTREYHGHTRDLDWHTNAHLTIGARYQSGLALSGLGGTGTGATWTFSSGTIWDEDLTANLLGGNQTTPGARVFYQVSGSAFTFADTAYPFIWNSGTSLVRAPAVGTFTLTDVASNRYINVWVYASNDPDRPFYFFTPAQTVFTSTANARAVGPPDLSLFGLTPEIKLLYRIVYRGDGVAQTAVAADDYRNSSVLPAGGTPATSASSVTFTPTGNYTATNVQAALAEIDVLAVHNAGPETITGRKTFSDTIMAGASVALAASINIASGVAPTTPADGDIWLTTAGLAARYNSTTVQVSAQVQKRTIRLRGQVMASVVLGAQSINVASPVTGTIVGWRIITDVATAASLEVWKKAGGVPTSGDIITASAPATISGVAYVASTTMTSWNTAVAVGDVFELNVASNTAAKVINLELDIVVD